MQFNTFMNHVHDVKKLLKASNIDTKKELKYQATVLRLTKISDSYLKVS